MSSEILITGSEGALGSYLVKDLSKAFGNKIINRVSRQPDLSKKTALNNQVIHKGDLSDKYFLQSIFNKRDIDTVIFCAAKWNGLNQDKDIFNANVELLEVFLDNAPNHLTNFVFISSSAVYKDHYLDSLEVTEDPISSYGRAKLKSENFLKEFCRNKDIKFTIYRPFHIVSPAEPYEKGRSHVVTDFLHKYIKLEQDFNWSSLHESPFIPFTWVEDISHVITENLFNKSFENEIYNLGSSVSYNLKELAFCIAKTCLKMELSSFDTFKNQIVEGPKENVFFNKINEEISFSFSQDLEEIVRKYILKKYT